MAGMDLPSETAFCDRRTEFSD